MHTFDQKIPRIGWACKYKHTTNNKLLEKKYNSRTTTLKWLNNQEKSVATKRLVDCIYHNLDSLKNLLYYTAKLPNSRRMLRLTSGIIPMATHELWKHVWQESPVYEHVAGRLADLGNFARLNDIRLSMHPGQFVVLASDRAQVVQNSMIEFEHHASIAKLMGYGKDFQDFKINVHLSGKKGPAGFRQIYKELSPVAQNCITIENDEMSAGLDRVLEIADLVPIVLDIHHHFIHTRGEYIQPSDSRFLQVIKSWRGVRPVIHYSVSKKNELPTNQSTTKKPIFEESFSRQKLRAHSDDLWNNDCNNWALEFLPYADIMVEAKNKNLAATELYECWKRNETTKGL